MTTNGTVVSQSSQSANGTLGSPAAAAGKAEEVSNSTNFSKGLGQFDMEDMALWHQFIYTTAVTLSNPWGHELPALALTCDYLLHGILCLGALHLGYTWSRDQAKRENYSFLAQHHFSMAIGSFRESVKNVTAENANQLFAFSTLLIVVNYASNRSPGFVFPFSGGEAYEGVSNWMFFIRGCTAIFDMARDHVGSGPLGFLITQGTKLQEILSTGARPSPEEDRSLARVKDEVLNLPSVKAVTTVEEMEAYHDAIERLRALLAASNQPLDSVIRRAVCSIWPSKVSETYVRLMKEERPPAMIIMAHYCLLFRGLEECWYMEHRGLALFQLVQDNLGEEWMIYVEYPHREISRKSFEKPIGR